MKKLTELFPLAMIAERLEASRVSAAPGSGFQGFEYEDLIDALAVHARLDDKVCERDRLDIAREAVSDAQATGVITENRLQVALLRVGRRFLARQKRPYVLLTSLSLPFVKGMTSTNFDGWRITFSKGRPSGFTQTHVPDDKMALCPAGIDFATYVRVSGLARSQGEAVEQALEVLDFLRGTWNLSLNRGQLWHGTNREERPINQIRSGPIYTLHEPSGKAYDSVWWYHHNPAREGPRHLDGRTWTDLLHHERAIRALVRETSMGKELRPLLVRYAGTLDGLDHDLALIQLWGLLEHLTGTANSAQRSVETARRAGVFFGDDPVFAFALEKLRLRRHRLAHVGIGGIESRRAAMQLHYFVAHLLSVALKLAPKFESLEEFGAFLALPNDPVKLKRDIKLRGHALRLAAGKLKGRRLRRR